MPTHTVNFDSEQFSYIHTSAGENGFSERARELVDLGMAVENSDLPEAADLMETDDFSPNAQDAITEVVRFYIEHHSEDGDSDE